MSKKNILGGCCGTEFGCCPDGKTAKEDRLGLNCPCTCWKHPSSLKCPDSQCGLREVGNCCKKKCNKKSKYDNGFKDCICDDKDENTEDQNLMQVISEKSNLTLFNTALNITSLPDILSGSDDYTVFAPTDDAFKKLGNLEEILDDIPLLESVLKLHIVPGDIKSNEINPGKTNVQTLNGQDIIIEKNIGISVSNESGTSIAQVIEPDIDAENGVIHVINNVLLPSSENSESSGGGMYQNVTHNIKNYDNAFYSKIYSDEY